MVTASSSLDKSSRDLGSNSAQPGVVENLLGKIQSIIPLVDRIKQSIQESSSSIPHASVQLTSVTQATELATVEILNVVDSMSKSLALAETELECVRDQCKVLEKFENEFTNQLETSTARFADDDGLQKLSELWHNRPPYHAGVTPITTIHNCLTSARDASVQITMALQVQDITTQQIAGVRHLIETVRLQLMNTLDEAKSKEKQEREELLANHRKATPFDVNAQYVKSTERQTTADKIVQQWNAKNDSQE